MKSLDHPFIVSLYDIFTADDCLYLVTEYLESGTLLQLINKRHGMSEDAALRVFYELIIALQYLHEEKHTCHRDIKPENILLDATGHIRLADFGFARIYGPENRVMNTSLGSPNYVSPEILLNRGYTAAADIWSAGVVLYAMLAGKLPFVGDNIPAILREILEEEPNFNALPSREVASLVKGMLNKDPQRRLTIPEILAHPWVARVASPTDAHWFAGMRILDGERLDDTVVAQMKALRISPAGLLAALTRGDLGNEVAAYKMLKREGLAAELGRWEAQRPVDERGRRISLTEVSPFARSYEKPRKGRLPAALTMRKRARELMPPKFPTAYTYGNIIGHEPTPTIPE
jgi:hypothetical protein